MWLICKKNWSPKLDCQATWSCAKLKRRPMWYRDNIDFCKRLLSLRFASLSLFLMVWWRHSVVLGLICTFFALEGWQRKKITKDPLWMVERPTSKFLGSCRIFMPFSIATTTRTHSISSNFDKTGNKLNNRSWCVKIIYYFKVYYISKPKYYLLDSIYIL